MSIKVEKQGFKGKDKYGAPNLQQLMNKIVDICNNLKYYEYI